MTRPLRIEYPNAWYHVMNRGAGYRPVFETDRHRGLFLELLAQISETFGVELHAYCLMGNHYHLLVKTLRANLGRAMRHLNGVYTQRHNRLLKTDGTLFRGRYKAILVEVDSYLLQVSRYIHRNPVEAGLVVQAQDYPWSSYRAYLRLEPSPPWLQTAKVLSMVSRYQPEHRYQAFIEAGLDEETAAYYSSARQKPILGTEAFRQARLAEQDLTISELPELRYPDQSPALETIIAQVAEDFGVTPDSPLHAQRGRRAPTIARAVAICLARNPGGHALRDIAAAFHLAHYTAVAVTIKRLHARMAKDQALANRIRQLAVQLNQKINVKI